MANSKISALPDGTTVAGTDEFVLARAGANYKLTWAQLMGAPGAFGNITPDAITGTTVTATTSPTTLGNGSAASHSLATNLSGGADPSIDFQNNQIILNNTQNLIINWVSPRLALATNSTVVGTGANQVTFGGNTSVIAGYNTTRTEINKAVTGIADNSATATFTVTIPNGAHSASLRVVLKASLGAGGSIGANESTRSIEYRVDVTRTAGVNAVATISAAGMNPAAAIVAGGQGLTVTGTLSSISGAVGATNTFTINATVARAGTGATNHTCFAYAELLNDNASGVTIV